MLTARRMSRRDLLRLASTAAISATVWGGAIAEEAVEEPVSDVATIAEFLSRANVSLSSAVHAAQVWHLTGRPFRAEISRLHPLHAFEVFVLLQGQVMRMEIDVNCGDVLVCKEESWEAEALSKQRQTVDGARATLGAAIDHAAKSTDGSPVSAEFRRNGQRTTAAIKFLSQGTLVEVEVDRVRHLSHGMLVRTD